MRYPTFLSNAAGRRFLVDWVGNYVFFCPLVIGVNHWWDKPEIMVPYLVSSIPVAAFGGTGFTMFLKHVWYPLTRTKW